MECKFCQAPLDEGMDVCPQCGKSQTEEQPEEIMTGEDVLLEKSPEEEIVEAPEEALEQDVCQQKKKTGKTVLIWVLAVLGAAVIALAGVLAWNSYRESQIPVENVQLITEQSYTVSAEEMTEDLWNTPVVKAEKNGVLYQTKERLDLANLNGGLTNGELAVYYWDIFYNFYDQYGVYVMMMGLDPANMDTTMSVNEGQTWQEYFLSQALNMYRAHVAVGALAEKEGYVLPAEMEDALTQARETLSAETDLQEQFLAVYGSNMTLDTYLEYLRRQYVYSGFLAETQKNVTYTDEELSAYYDEHAEEYAQQGVLKDVVATDSKTQAEEVYAQWQAGEATEDSFAILANETSTDPGSNTVGGLYSNVTQGQMVQPFNDWCFDAARKPGDTGIVETDYGHHVMYFVSANDDGTVNVRHILLQSADPDAWKEAVAEDYADDYIRNLIAETSQRYVLNYDLSKIALLVPSQITAEG